MKWADRLQALGFATYWDYLGGDHWTDFKKRYRAAGLSRRCQVCNCQPVALHHISYDRLGDELLEDVIPLCQDHHRAVHALLKKEKLRVDATAWAVDHLKGKIVPKPSKTVHKKRSGLKWRDAMQRMVTDVDWRRLVTLSFQYLERSQPQSKGPVHQHIRQQDEEWLLAFVVREGSKPPLSPKRKKGRRRRRHGRKSKR